MTVDDSGDSGNMTMQPISRVESKPFTTVDEAVEADRKYFAENPDEEEYIREFVPGEFGKAELPQIPPGFRYATHVSVMYREGVRVGRYRRLMTVCEADEMRHQGYLP
jgi:hypothetical protein